MPNAVTITDVSHSYPPSRRQHTPRIALSDLSFTIQQGEMFALLGPNGSGKSTLFRILSTLLTPTSGSVRILDMDLQTQVDEIRHRIGVVFQNPSLDKKLTAKENLLHQGHLYDLRGSNLAGRIEEMLSTVGMLERADDFVENLSGGMQRRVELAKALLHNPQLLILDEPSTGLDPGARRDFGSFLQTLQKKNNVTVLLTTHILDEAEHCDRIALLDKGMLVALGTPHDLKKEIGGDVISLTCEDAETLCSSIQRSFGGSARVVDGIIHIERANGHEFIPELIHAFPGIIESIRLSKPSLEDVFIHKTGHTFWHEDTAMAANSDNV